MQIHAKERKKCFEEKRWPLIKEVIQWFQEKQWQNLDWNKTKIILNILDDENK